MPDWLRQRLREAIALRERVCDTTVPSPGARRGRSAARAGDRPLRRCRGAAGEHRRDGSADAADRRGAHRAAAAARRRRAQRLGGAPTGRIGGERGAAVRHRRDRRGGGRRRAVPGRSAGRAEDRLVLRSAAEPRSRGGAGERCARAGRVLPCRRVRPALCGGRRARGDAGGQQRTGAGAGRAGGGAERALPIACMSGATMRSMR